MWKILTSGARPGKGGSWGQEHALEGPRGAQGSFYAQKREMACVVLSGFSVCRPIGGMPRENRVFPKPAVKNNTHTTPIAAFSPLGALFGLPFLAQITSEGTEVASALEKSTGLPGVDMTRYAMVCLGLVAAILALAWGFRRVLTGNLRGRAARRSMRVVDILPLGGKRQLAVVRCYDRTFVLGLGERDVTLISELDAAEDVEGNLEIIANREAAHPKNKEEGAALIPAAPAPPKVGLFSSILTSARKSLAHSGHSEARVVSAAQAKAAAPAAVAEITYSEAATRVASPPKEVPTDRQSVGGGWVG